MNREANGLFTASSLEALSACSIDKTVRDSRPVMRRGTSMPCLPLSIDQAVSVTCIIRATEADKSMLLLICRYICPITTDLMEQPVFASDGYVYEKSAIERWFQGHNTSPMTNKRLTDLKLQPCHPLRSAIQSWCEQHPDAE